MRLIIVWMGVMWWLSAAGGQPAALKGEMGMLAPDFSLPDHNGKVVSLKDFLGKKAVLLAFYPRAGTPG
jgi:cytochrome oxidase Cu insertion factor (SCO1/SenC/PrrC family)